MLTISRHPYLQLKYHETGKEKNCLPQVGQWNMMNKVPHLSTAVTSLNLLIFC